MAVVYSRAIDGGVLTLAPSGWTYGELAFESVFVLMDKETKSMWYPAGEQSCALPVDAIGKKDVNCGLVGIGGFYAGRVLSGQNLSSTTWSEWKTQYPDTKFVRSY